MNIVWPLSRLNLDLVTLLPPVKNTVMENSTFRRALYSDTNAVFNSIVCSVDLEMERQEKWFNKWKCTLPLGSQRDVNRLILLEHELLQLAHVNKTPYYSLRDQLYNGLIKTFNNKQSPQDLLVIKICGVWENAKEFGLTYKLNFVRAWPAPPPAAQQAPALAAQQAPALAAQQAV